MASRHGYDSAVLNLFQRRNESIRLNRSSAMGLLRILMQRQEYGNIAKLSLFGDVVSDTLRMDGKFQSAVICLLVGCEQVDIAKEILSFVLKEGITPSLRLYEVVMATDAFSSSQKRQLWIHCMGTKRFKNPISTFEGQFNLSLRSNQPIVKELCSIFVRVVDYDVMLHE